MISKIYNFGRLGQAGEEVLFETGEEERAELARDAGLLGVPAFAAKVSLKKLSPSRFSLHYDFAADIIQACVVSLEPVPARIAGDFVRELHYAPALRRAEAAKEIVIVPGEDDLPEEIESLHYDLAGPLLEEFLLAIDPYPRAPGVEFAPPQEEKDAPESPFTVLKGLKSPG